MTFMKMDCPECAERILVDSCNDIGYCMYCGAEVETHEAVTIYPDLDHVIRDFLDDDREETEYDWFNDLMHASEVLMDEGPESATPLFVALHREDMGEEESAHLYNCIRQEFGTWISTCHDSIGYTGGALQFADEMGEWFSKEGKMDLILHSLSAITVHSAEVETLDQMDVLVSGMYFTIRDAIEGITDVEQLASTMVGISDVQMMLVMSLMEFGTVEELNREMENGWMIGQNIILLSVFDSKIVSMEDGNIGPDDIVRDPEAFASAHMALLQALDGNEPIDKDAMVDTIQAYFDEAFRSPGKPNRRSSKRSAKGSSKRGSKKR